MRKILHIGLLITLLLGMFSFALPAFASTPQNYSVLVGAEDTTKGVSLSDYFPHTVRLHVGDSITWTINSHEIHTVTFLAGQTLQPLLIPAPQGMDSPLQINPEAFFTIAPANGLYDGSSYVNSGIMSADPGAPKTFTLTFTRVGVYPYVCYVHGEMMSGSVEVVGSSTAVPTPAQVTAQGQAELKAAWLRVPTVMAKAVAQVVPPVKNADGSMTHTVVMGYEAMDIMIMKFFPSHVTVRPGDTMVWKLSSTGLEAPHTVTFYNGTPDQSLFKIEIGPNGPVALVNPSLLFPSDAVLQGKPLNNTDFFHSGMLVPGVHTSFSIKVGNITGTLNYECALHDTSGMTASLFVVK